MIPSPSPVGSTDLARRVRGALAALATASLLSLTGCMAGPAPTASEPPTDTPTAEATEAAEAAPEGVAVSEATLTRVADDATLAATLTNEGAETVTLRAIACPCAGMVQLGTPSGEELTPLSTGLSVAAGESAEIGTEQVEVRLTGVTDAVEVGSEVTLQAYFGTAGVVEFTAQVVEGD